MSGFFSALSDEEISGIEKKIGYYFKDKRLLSKAFTHSSFVNENKGAVSNERLEFLGDRVLNLVCAEELFFNNAGNEGKLSEQLRNWVSAEPLKKSIDELGLNSYIKTSVGLDIKGSSKAISDLFEAIVAAIYIDSNDLEPCRCFVKQHLKQIDIHDYITFFKEWCEKTKVHAEKTFQEVKKGNEVHYVYQIKVNGKEFHGEGRKIKDAEKAACFNACKSLKIDF